MEQRIIDEEISGLKWINVDLARRTFVVKEVRTSAGARIVVKAPKNITSQRTEYIVDELLSVFQRLRQEYIENKELFGVSFIESDLVVAYPNGQPYRPNYLSELVTKFIVEKGLPPLHLHELRHSFATVANDLGIPMYNIGKALGHSTPSITAKIYTHLLDTDHENIMQQVANSINTKRIE